VGVADAREATGSMKIFIAGGTGHVGSRLAAVLHAGGHVVTIGSRRSGVDVLTGRGLGAAVAGAEVVVDVLNVVEPEEAPAVAFFRGTTERLLAAEQTVGVRHHLVLSVVGADRTRGNGYYAGKVAQEDAVMDGDTPFTILRATQFHEFLPTLADWLTTDGTVRAPRTLLQPVALDDVVSTLAQLTLQPAADRRIDLAGPGRHHLDDLLRATLARRSDPRTVTTVLGEALGAEDSEALLPLGKHRIGSTHFPV
jgi:uncharacterized protein YbjT (DUF2867 family)